MTIEPILTVLLYGSITALATGLGAIPFLFIRRVSDSTVALTNAVASGLMLGASFGLIIEGSGIGTPQSGHKPKQAGKNM